MRRTRLAAGATLALLAVGLGATQALAWWTVPGRGTGAAVTGDAGLLTVLTPAAGLVPGAWVDVEGSVRTTTATPVVVTALPVTVTADPAHPGCSPAGSVTAVARTAVPFTAGPAPSALTVRVSLAVDAPDACQGAVLSVTVTPEGRSR